MKKIYAFLLLNCLFYYSYGQSFLSTVDPATVSIKARTASSGLASVFKPTKITYVKIGSLKSIAKDGYLKFAIPGSQKTILAEATHIEYLSDASYKWFGNIVGEETGHVILLCDKGIITADITTDKQKYQIYHVDQSVHALVALNTAPAPFTECNSVGGATKRSANDVQPLSACAEKIRILVLSSDKARQANASIEQIAKMSVEQINSALYASAVPSPVKAEFVGYVPISFSENSIDISDDANILSNMPNVKGLRNQYQADIVVLLTNGNYGFLTGGVIYGVVKKIFPTSEDAYSIVDVGASTSQYTFAHEIGHIMGGAHENDYSPAIPTYAHGHAYENHAWPFVYRYHTLMHRLTENRTRTLRYSNPNIKDGSPTGNDKAYNARRITETNATVSTYRTSPGVLISSIAGPAYLPRYQRGVWTASANCGYGNYLYEWYSSADGVNYQYTNGGTTFNSTFYTCNQRLFIKLTVRSNDGQVSNSFLTVNGERCTDGGGGGGGGGGGPRDPLRVAEQSTTVESSTNELSYSLAESMAIHIQLFDLKGQTIKSIEPGHQSEGLHKLAVPTGVAPGVYIYQVTGPGSSRLKK